MTISGLLLAPSELTDINTALASLSNRIDAIGTGGSSSDTRVHVQDYYSPTESHDTDALRRACEVLDEQGGGTLVFRPREYTLYPTGCDLSPIAQFQGLRGVELEGNGCKLTVQRAFTDSEQLVPFSFYGCRSTKISGFEIVSQVQPFAETYVRGILPFTFYQGCKGITIEDIEQTGGVSTFWNFRNPMGGEPLSHINTGVCARNIITHDVGYPIVLAHSGDDATLENIYVERPTRGLFMYGVQNVKASLRVKDYYIDALNMSAFGPNSDRPSLKNIDVSLTILGRTTGFQAPNVGVDLVCKGPDPVTITNVRLNIDADMTNNPAALIRAGKVIDTPTVGTLDTETRGHTISGFMMTGIVRNTTVSPFDLFPNWSSGEHLSYITNSIGV